MYKDIKTIAFYLPQYHVIPENEEWWGKGFTEWTNVKKAKPNFPGHYQPHKPHEDISYYDLLEISIQKKQIKIAKEYGIYGFCYHHYWFSGKQILEKPLENILRNKSLNFPFCISWANENWTRTWDGKEKDILIAQNQTLKSDNQFIEHVLKYFSDDRYIKISGKPLLLVYRIEALVDAKKTMDHWRKFVIKNGFKGLYICAVDFYDTKEPSNYNVDALVEFPPHRLFDQYMVLNQDLNFEGNNNFSGQVIDYEKVMLKALSKELPSYKYFRGIMPSWDNSARRKDNPHIFLNSNPFNFEFWLSEIIKQTKEQYSKNEQLVFINAWNEWGEGCHIEPDEKYGYAYLESIQNVLKGEMTYEVLIKKLENKKIFYYSKEGELLLRVLEAYKHSLNAFNNEVKRLISQNRSLKSEVANIGKIVLKKFLPESMINLIKKIVNKQ